MIKNKPKPVYLLLVLSLLTGSVSFAQVGKLGIPQDSGKTIITIDSASVFAEVNDSIHAITFDGKGSMFVGGCHDIYRITPERVIEHFATLSDTSSVTTIWGMTFHPNGDLFVAAHDRIVKITPSGTQLVVIRENFPGPCGVTDLRFDRKGRLLAAYADIVARYDASYNKSIFISGKDFRPPIQWSVSIEFGNQDSTLYIADCKGKQLYLVPYFQTDSIHAARIIPTNLGQYLTKNRRGEIFLAMHGPPTFPEFLMLKGDSSEYFVHCTTRPPQNRQRYKKAIAWGNTGFNTQALYCIIGGTVYIYEFK
jgi:hypothetical protein